MNVFITKGLLQLVNVARNSYQTYLDVEKKKLYNKKLQRKIEKKLLRIWKGSMKKKKRAGEERRKQEVEEVKATSHLFRQEQSKLLNQVLMMWEHLILYSKKQMKYSE